MGKLNFSQRPAFPGQSIQRSHRIAVDLITRPVLGEQVVLGEISHRDVEGEPGTAPQVVVTSVVLLGPARGVDGQPQDQPP